jgi:rRNA maturation RNase YbeY
VNACAAIYARARAAGDSRPPLVLGDVVISVDTARRQSHALDVATAARIRTLLIHGLLHLLGYDHERSPAEARCMFARERELAAGLAEAQGQSPPLRAAAAPARAAAGKSRVRPKRPKRDDTPR